MRSSKSRSRGKNRNNNRSVGNIVNRVFDSSGPEGKVRGTPQQIIDKYQQLYRDAQLSNDRVAAENFAQHAEHYTRMLGEALREQEARREAHEAQQRERQREREEQQQAQGGQPGESDQPEAQSGEQPRQRGRQGAPESSEQPEIAASGDDVIDLAADGDAGLVETVEDAPKKPRRRRSRKSDTAADAPAQDTPPPSEASAAE